MLVGTVVSSASKRSVCVLSNQGSGMSAPALATDGVPIHQSASSVLGGSDVGACFLNRSSHQFTFVFNTVDASGPSCDIWVWGYLAAGGQWYCIDGVTSISAAPYSSQIQTTMEDFKNLCHYDRVYVQLANPANLGATGLSGWLTTDSGHAV